MNCFSNLRHPKRANTKGANSSWGLPYQILDAALQLTLYEADDDHHEPFCIWLFRPRGSEEI